MIYPKVVYNYLFIVIGFILFSIGSVKSQNLVKNAGFESGVYNDFWSVWNGNAQVSNVNSHSGNYAVKLSVSGMSFFQNINVSPGVNYTASVWVKNDPGATVFFGVKGFGNPEVKTSSGSSSYVKLELSFTPTVGFDVAQIYLYKSDNKATFADDFSLTGLENTCVDCFEGGKGNYFVKENGDDSRSGTSIEDAWKTIEKVNKGNFKPGDVIHFEGGKTFSGTLILNENDAGSTVAPVRITSFGSSPAVINGDKLNSIRLERCSNIKIDKLEMTGSGRKTGNVSDGIKIYDSRNIDIVNCKIHGFQHGGVNISMSSDIKLSDLDAFDNGFAGITSMGVLNGIRNKNIYIGYSRVFNNPGDPTVLDNHSGNGIVMGETDDVLIEYCEAYNNGWDMPRIGNGPVGIWAWNGNNVVIQNCISHHNKTSPGGGDGGGFDLDGGMTNSIIQYCLSYNNQGSGFGIFQFAGAAKWDNNTIRYCISENDGNITAGGNVYIWNGSSNNTNFSNLNFYNNVIYNDQKACISFADHFYSNFRFYNNVFISNGSATKGGIGGETYLGNCWWTKNGGFNVEGQTDFKTWANTTGKEIFNNNIKGINVNPEYFNPGKSVITDPASLKSFNDYHLPLGSLLRSSGINLKLQFGINPGQKDFFGFPLAAQGGNAIGIQESANNIVTDMNSSIDSEKLIFPNPFIDVFTIDLKNNGVIKQVQLIASDGSVILDISPQYSLPAYTLNSGGIPKGIYIVKIYTDKDTIVRRIMKY